GPKLRTEEAMLGAMQNDADINELGGGRVMHVPKHCVCVWCLIAHVRTLLTSATARLDIGANIPNETDRVFHFSIGRPLVRNAILVLLKPCIGNCCQGPLNGCKRPMHGPLGQHKRYAGRLSLVRQASPVPKGAANPITSCEQRRIRGQSCEFHCLS